MSSKKYLDVNVYDALKDRLAFIFKEFEQVVVSFSGGKDSGVMLNLTVQYAKEKGLLSKVAVYHMDYEAQYQETTDYVKSTMESLPKEVTKYWIALPVIVPCATSMYQNHWIPWEKSKKNIWVRDLPKDSINEDNFPWGFDYHCRDYEFNNRFAEAISATRKTVFVVGIRAQESLHRLKAVQKQRKDHEYKGKAYTTINDGYVNAYPMYDWTTDDIWVANAKFGFKYNHLYDLMYQAGVPLNSMRVASPFLNTATESLRLYKALDPNTWYKLVGRVNGVNFTSIYGNTAAMGWNGIKKPDNFTWKQYMYFLLNTLPEDTRENYMRKLETSIKYWTDTGGALPEDVIDQLPEGLDYEDLGAPKSNRHYTKPYRVLRFKKYLDEVDSKHPNLLPTYKRICIAIMKNDTSLKTAGFGQTKAELEKRHRAIEKYQSIL